MSWIECKLIDLTTIYSGYAFKAKELSESKGIPLIKIKNIHDRIVDKDVLTFLPKDLFKPKYEKYILREGDILVAMTGQGSVGRIGKMMEVDKTYLVNQRVGIIRVNTDIVDREFLFQLLANPPIENIYFNLAAGAGQPNLSPKDIGNLDLNIPKNINTQRKIADILSAYDDLIENNLKRIKLLEQAAQNIYKEWFVNMRFPGYEEVKFDSETGLPVDWKITSLNELATYFGRGITPKYEEGSGLLGINQKVNKGYLLEHQFMKEFDSRMDIPDSKYSQFGDVLINSLGEGTIGRIHFYSGKSFIHPVDQHISIFRAKNLGLSLYSYLFFSSDKGQGLLSSIKKGGTNMTMLNIGDLRKLEIIIPDNKVLCCLEDKILLFYKKINVLVEQNQNLKSARDILLPRLMNQTIEV